MLISDGKGIVDSVKAELELPRRCYVCKQLVPPNWIVKVPGMKDTNDALNAAILLLEERYK